MSTHRIEKCVHGVTHAQCRCPAPDKPVYIVPCDPRVCDRAGQDPGPDDRIADTRPPE